MAATAAVVGEWWWVKDEARCFIAGRIEAVATGESVTVAVEDSSRRVPLAELASRCEVEPEALAAADDDDLVQMEEVSRPSIVDALRRRYLRDAIYTSVADILVAMNPFKALPALYDDAALRRYLNGQDDASLKPHPFKTTMAAYGALRATRRGQAILISGESGAGKTETTKQCLRMLGHRAGGATGIDRKVIATNPILETLGNAKTVRNDNSSRFGKFMRIRFDARFRIAGCEIDEYLLEKSRVTSPGADERSYHVFYQLCTAGHRALRYAAAYPYLANSGCFEIPGVDEAEAFAAFSGALTNLSYVPQAKFELFDAIVAVLLASRIDFLESTDEQSCVAHEAGPGAAALNNGGRRRSSIANVDASVAAARALGISPAALEDCLTHRTLRVGGTLLKTSLNGLNARDSRDALAKHLYGALFEATVKTLNHVLRGDDEDENPPRRSSSSKTMMAPLLPPTIGVLDIFGFEIFAKNSLEQLCINFCNEKLQQIFTKHTFREEVDLYATEQIPFEPIVFADNEDAIDLLENRKRGILRLLDDEVSAPGGSDENFAAKLHKGHWAQHRRLTFDKRHPNLFVFDHYTGKVTYDVADFVAKNKDRLYDNVAAELRKSTNTLVAGLFAAPEEDPKNINNSNNNNGNSNNNNNSDDDDDHHHHHHHHASSSRKTASSRFVSSLGSLIRVLDASTPHFVRCVKPNSSKKPRCFEGPLTYDQLTFSGVFEAVQIRRQGYPFRAAHGDFYRELWHAAASSSEGGPRKALAAPRRVREMTNAERRGACATLVEALAAQLPNPRAAEECAAARVGVSRVLWRIPAQRHLAAFRRAVALKVSLVLQTAARASVAVRLRGKLEVARDEYARAAVSRDSRAVDAALARVGPHVSFVSRDLQRLRVLKERFEREKDLEPKLAAMVAGGIAGVDEALIRECSRLELDSDLFKEAEILYVKFVERETAKANICKALEINVSATEEIDEAALQVNLATLDKLVRTYGADEVGCGEIQRRARDALRRCRDERNGRCKLLALLLPASSSSSSSFSDDDDDGDDDDNDPTDPRAVAVIDRAFAAFEALADPDFACLASKAVVTIARARSASRAALQEALGTQDDDDDDDDDEADSSAAAWAAARAAAVAARERIGVALADAARSADPWAVDHHDDADVRAALIEEPGAIVAVCDERDALYEVCTRAVARDPFVDEAEVAEAQGACDALVSDALVSMMMMMTKKKKKKRPSCGLVKKEKKKCGPTLCPAVDGAVRDLSAALGRERRHRDDVCLALERSHLAPRLAALAGVEDASAAVGEILAHYGAEVPAHLELLEACAVASPRPGLFLARASPAVATMARALAAVGGALRECREHDGAWPEARDRALEARRSLIAAAAIQAGRPIGGGGDGEEEGMAALTRRTEGDLNVVIGLVGEREALVAACNEAMGTRPSDERVLRRAIARCAAPSRVVEGARCGPLLCATAERACRAALDRLLEERRLLNAVANGLAAGSLPTVEAWLDGGGGAAVQPDRLAAACRVAEAFGLEALGAADFVKAARQVAEARAAAQKAALEAKAWDRDAGDGYLAADRATRLLARHVDALSSEEEAEAAAAALVDCYDVQAEVDVLADLAQRCSARAFACDELTEAVRDVSDDTAIFRLRRAVEVGRGLGLPSDADAGFSGWSPEEAAEAVDQGAASLAVAEEALRGLCAATEAVDTTLLEAALDRAQAIGYVDGLAVVAALDLLRRIVAVRARVHGAKRALDRSAIQTALAEADAMGLADPAFARLRAAADDSTTSTSSSISSSTSSSSETHFLKAMLLVAFTDRDAHLATAASLRLRDRAFGKKGAASFFFDLAKSPAIKSPAEFAGVKFADPPPDFSQRKLMGRMLAFDDRPLAAPLTRRLADDGATARLVSCRILGFMGDSLRPHPERETLADRLVEECLRRPPVADEVYAQVLKQLDGNPGRASIARGERLLVALIRAQVAPSPTLLVYVEAAARARWRNLHEDLVATYLGGLLARLPVDSHHRTFFQGALDVVVPGPMRRTRRRHFAVDGAHGTLTIHQKPPPPHEEDRAPLAVLARRDGITVRSLPGQDSFTALSYPFLLDNSNEPIVLAAITAEDRAAWITAIQSVFRPPTDDDRDGAQ